MFCSSQIYVIFLSQTTIGPLKVNLKHFEENMGANKLDLEKMCRNMVVMAWSAEERVPSRVGRATDSQMLLQKFQQLQKKFLLFLVSHMVQPFSASS